MVNRGGDRHLNRTLHDILLTRWRTCQRTRAYITRRRAEGKTDPEIPSSATSPGSSTAASTPRSRLDIT